MSLYVKNVEVSQLAARLAFIKGVSKTEAVKLALTHELEREQAHPSLVEQGVAFCRTLKQRSDLSQARPMSKADIDALYEPK